MDHAIYYLGDKIWSLVIKLIYHYFTVAFDLCPSNVAFDKTYNGNNNSQYEIENTKHFKF